MRKRVRTIAVVSAIAGLLVSCTPPEERAQKARETIQQEVARGDRTAALEAVDELRASLPDTADSLLEVARLLVAAGDAPRAGWMLEDGLRRFPGRDDVRIALAHVSLLLGNPTRAREVVLPIAAGSEQDAAALVTRAQAELALGSLDEALATLSEAEKRHPDRPEARLVRIATLLSEHREDEARAAVEEARRTIAGDDEESAALRRRLDLTLAQIQAQQGDAEAALASLRGLVASEPGDLLAWRALVQVLAQQDRSAEALPILQAALEKDATSPGLYLLVAQVDEILGRADDAEETLRELAERSDSPAGVLPLVQLYSRRGDAEAARDVLDQALAKHPDESALRVLRTEALLALGRVDEARAEVARYRGATFEGDPQVDYLQARLQLAEGDAAGAADRLRALAPRLDRAATQYWLGRALEAAGDFDGALRRYALADRRDPSWTAPPMAMIALEQRRGNWRAVASAAEALARRDPRELSAWSALVTALENLGDGAAAERAARESLKRFPGRAEPHVLLARALRAQGRTDEALAALDEGRLEPGADLAAERALTLGLGGRTQEGIRVAREALGRQPDSAALQAALASLLFATGAADEGSAATDRALALAPDEPRPLRVRCEFRASTGRFQGARDDCARYLAVRPDDGGAQFMLGVALAQAGDAAGAAAAYRRAAELDEHDARPRNNLAELLAAEGDLDGALAAAQEAFRLDEKNAYVMDTLGSLYVRKGLAARAVSLLEEAHAGLPDVPEVTLHLALAYRDAGRVDEARTLLADLDQSASDALRPRVDEALGSLP